MMAYPMNVITYGLRKGDFTVGPAAKKWLDEMRARPAWQKGLKRMEAEQKDAKAKL